MNSLPGAALQSDRDRLSHSIDAPIRSENPHEEDLGEIGASLARNERENPPSLRDLDIRRHTEVIARDIADVVSALSRAQEAGEAVTPAANWLLDNSYLIEEAIAEVRRDLPPKFYNQLPKAESTGIPRVLMIAWHYVAHTDSAVASEDFSAIVDGFQTETQLRIGELWALPSVLRFVLLENLRRLAIRVERSRQLRLLANRVADRLAKSTDEADIRILEEHAAVALDRSFATQMLHRLRDGSRASHRALTWLERKLEGAGSDAEEAILEEHATQSSGNVTTGNIVKGLRLIDDTDWTGWFEEVSHIDRLLREKTHFERLDFTTRDSYRRAIENLAKRSGRGECEVAEKSVEFARSLVNTQETAPGGSIDIGCVLIGHDRPEFERHIGYRVPWPTRFRRAYRATGWLGMAVPVAVLTLALMIAAGFALDDGTTPYWAIVLIIGLFALPASEAAAGMFNTIVLLFVKPTRLPGYEYKAGVPPEARTMVVIPTILGGRDDVDDAAHSLVVHYLSNMSGEIHFAILSDWPDSQREQSAADEEILDYARAQIETLNARYPREGEPRFFLLHRRRLYNEQEECWMGWERKRGKLHELNVLLRGDGDTTFFAPAGKLPDDVQYIMTLDADTRMTRDAVNRLVGKLQHPMNRPVIDPETGRVVAGYSVLQPRITPSLTTGDEASFFQRVFSSNRGMDHYVFAVSDVYQDLFDAGTFTGKGLYHLESFDAALRGRIPENTVLSHDLLEGALANSALVTDVELVEDYPTRYLVDASRHHRWARGDWQLLGWIFGRGAEISGLSRWKMVDNLRRTLTPVFWVATLIAAWLLLPLATVAQWQALMVLTLFLSLTFGVVNAVLPRTRKITLGSHFAAFGRDFALASAQVVIRLVLMPHVAVSMCDAIGRTLYRMFVSRKHLLEWRTASQADRAGGRSLGAHFAVMQGSLYIAGAGLALALLSGAPGLPVAVAYAILWGAAPAVAWLVSRSAETEDRLQVDPADATALRRIARRTWLYFETFVTSEHNMLPPDNFQEVPVPVVAARTSPTNIGVYLLSIVSARDFGWLSFAETIERIGQTLDTIEKMDRYRGHLYNWYDTRTLVPLQPLYVSSVDSGNLAGHLIAVSSACRTWADAPAAHLQGDFEGMLDAVGILEESLDRLPDDRRSLRPLRQRLRERLEGMRRAVNTVRNEPETAAIRTINLTVHAVDIKSFAQALHEEVSTSESEELTLWAAKVERCCQAHMADAHMEIASVAGLREKLVELGERARKFAFEMDFGFLFNAERKLLSIGYRLVERQQDEACYDLLASEARLTSLFAIAKGDLPTEHWFRLGRPVTEIGFSGALVSWSGSMFEYLMPPLVMKEPIGGILSQSSKLVIRRQMAYARSRNVPWGISEAAYNARDREMTYQYMNFGVPGLGLKRGLGQELVIAPYASLLAAQFLPAEAMVNLRRLADIGACGRYGYHDAVDFTPGRVPENETHAVVRNFMAHHHGMSIVAVANVVFEGRMRDRFHADPVIEASELLLQEKAPREIPSTPIRAEAAERVKPAIVDDRPDSRLIASPMVSPHAVTIMSNGHYNLMLTARGTGYSRADQISVTRWIADQAEDRTGTFLFIRDMEEGTWWSATAEPRRMPGEQSSAFFCDEKATFSKTVGQFRSEVECIVVGEGNGEARRITLINDGEEDRQIEVTSFAEVALAYEAADSAHPAFSKMFVKTEIVDGAAPTIFATRRKRSSDDPSIALAHFVTAGVGVERQVQAETDRRKFIGAGRTLADAAAFDPGVNLTGSAGHVLDPVMALRCKVRVPAHQKVSLTFWTVVAANREDVEREIQRFRHGDGFARQAMLAWTRSQVQARHVGINLAEAAGVQRLARYLLFPHPVLRAQPSDIAGRLGPQSSLWPMSISGDFPIFVLRIGDVADTEVVASALRMQEYLRSRGLLADLVIVNEQASSYVQDLQNAIDTLCENARSRGRELGPRQHIFAVRRDLIDSQCYGTLIASARIVLHTRNGSILDQIDRADAALESMPGAALATVPEATPAPAADLASRMAEAATETQAPEGLEFWNGYGGFADGGRAYVIRLSGNRVTPQPWINVISNGDFGFHTSAEGASFTWSRNSRDFQITPWSNDPVSNRPGEGFYIHDLESGESFSPQASVLRDPEIEYEARHEPGFSRFMAASKGVEAELAQLVDPADPVKVQRLTLTNNTDRVRRLRVYGYVEWLLGNNRAKSAPYIVPRLEGRVLTAANPYHVDFGDRVAFFACDAERQDRTCDRTEFIGRGGSTRRPAAVMGGHVLSGTVEAGRDPCAAISADIEVGPGETAALNFVLGDAASSSEAAALAARHLGEDFGQRIKGNRAIWQAFAQPLQVESPDPAFDAMVNVWLPYQSLACRVRARSAFYQASGAFGFRDQLQDTLALLLHDPSLARTQILNAAGRQFPEGDVQHWWLPRSGAGVRTIISDDVVWLAYAVARYVHVTGDEAILDEEIPFIEGPDLEQGQHDAFFPPERSDETGTLYQHCVRALELAMERKSERGLPLILGGDWNDGMNRVGEEGRGESVWLGWFLYKALGDLAAIAETRGDTDQAAAWREHARELAENLDRHAWDGEWYQRGTFDDGTPLGSKDSQECRIDSIAQSWSVISGGGEPERAGQAISKALEVLIDEEARILRLFTPPFEHTDKEPGYIKSYPPGVRENGGQYTHAAIWMVVALAELGRADDAYRVFSMLNPVTHALNEEDAERYRVEPYVVAADIYSGGEKSGRGGWTWYTGSAGWLYRAAVESILGIDRQGDRLHIAPQLPAEWDGCTVRMKFGEALYTIAMRRGEAFSISVDGEECASVAIAPEGEYSVVVTLPRQQESSEQGAPAQSESDEINSGNRRRGLRVQGP